jgi:Holliday junction resolvasome RuvABC endonuclease subunit
MGFRTVILAPGFDRSGTILGLDCSSSTVGWGLLGRQPFALVAHGHFNPLSAKNPLMERLDNVFDSIAILCAEFNPATVVVEDIIQHMRRGGGSSAHTITILAAFNRVAALAAWRHTHDVLFYPVATIRKTIREGVGRQTKIEKEDMPAIVRSHLCPDFSDVVSKKGSVSDLTMDEADGIAVAWCHALLIGESYESA